jgi:hypothetical protein
MNHTIKHKRALVTGGSHGIGASIYPRKYVITKPAGTHMGLAPSLSAISRQPKFHSFLCQYVNTEFNYV